ncbi:hypothetical protein BD311DRAFT_759980 [Dichomitus squalens]|uniref:Uncharacterized protein n=1 Tax=Dichomitus squalens TaxID=114155 RepID=A0A4Q9MJ78_9APHY|nr:hypothetical protein BD311DRAFT_759980 [Dichomitus squalens]
MLQEHRLDEARHNCSRLAASEQHFHVLHMAAMSSTLLFILFPALHEKTRLFLDSLLI